MNTNKNTAQDPLATPIELLSSLALIAIFLAVALLG